VSTGGEALARVAPLRIAEYSVFPRTERNHRVQAGFTRDEPGSEMVLVTSSPESVGALLRVRIQGLEAHDSRDTLARVAACQQINGRFELQLEALDARTPRRVRRHRPAREA
jgi:hypothetical protein